MSKEFFLLEIIMINKKWLKNIIDKKFNKVSLFNLAVFTKQFALMYKSGLGLAAIINVLGEQTSSVRLKAALKDIRYDITSHGETIHDAFAEHKDIFPPFYLAMIKIGEKAGGKTFTAILEKLSDAIEGQNTMQVKITSALSYPVTVLTVGFLVVFASAYFILPKFLPILNSYNVKLPLSTQILAYIVYFFSNIWLTGLFVILVYLLINFFLYFIRTPYGNGVFEGFIMSVPVVNNFIMKINAVYFCRTLALLYESGIPLVDALNSVKGVMVLNLFKNYIEKLIAAIKDEGARMEEYLYIHPLFPQDLVQIVAVGEETGELALVLHKLTNLYEMELDCSLRTLINLLEPLLMIIMGMVVFFIVLSVFLPLYSMFEVMQN